MPRTFVVMAAAAFAAAVALHAQTPAAPARGSSPPSAERYVIIGCVSRATPPAGATAGAAAAGFILTDARGPSPSIYQLDGDEKELTFQVGHTVELSGTLTVAAGAANGPPTRTLKIERLVYVSTTCQKIR